MLDWGGGADAPDPAEVDRQFLTQCQVLTSRPLLEKVAPEIGYLGEAATTGEDPVTALQGMLSADPVTGTRVVVVHADGADRLFLPKLVNEGRPRSMASKKRGVSTICSSHAFSSPFFTSTTIFPCPSTRVMWWTSTVRFLGAMSLRLFHCQHLVGHEHRELGLDFLGLHAVVQHHLAQRGQVGVGDHAAAAFAAIAVSGANGVTAREGDRAQADLALRVHADVLFELALDAQRLVRDLGQAALEQVGDGLDQLVAVDRAAGQRGLDWDDLGDRAMSSRIIWDARSLMFEKIFSLS